LAKRRFAVVKREDPVLLCDKGDRVGYVRRSAQRVGRVRRDLDLDPPAKTSSTHTSNTVPSGFVTVTDQSSCNANSVIRVALMAHSYVAGGTKAMPALPFAP
jgi:hypothetical protein